MKGHSIFRDPYVHFGTGTYIVAAQFRQREERGQNLPEPVETSRGKICSEFGV